jgi:type III secretion protein J
MLLSMGCSADILHDLSEEQANRVVTVLEGAGIPASRERDESAKGRWGVAVPSVSAGEARALIREYELPGRASRGFAETFQKTSLIPTPTEERAMLVQAVTGELERTLQSIDAVTLARVHVNLPRQGEKPAGRATAAVMLKVKAGARVDPSSIRRLVAGSVEDLSEDRVAVELFEPASPPKQIPLAQVGPFLVARSSSALLKGSLVGCAILVISMGLFLGAAFFRPGWLSARPGGTGG